MVRQKKATSKRRGRAKSASSGTDKEQSARFLEMARTLGVDESGKQFKETFEKIVPAKGRAT